VGVLVATDPLLAFLLSRRQAISLGVLAVLLRIACPRVDVQKSEWNSAERREHHTVNFESESIGRSTAADGTKTLGRFARRIVGRRRVLIGQDDGVLPAAT